MITKNNWIESNQMKNIRDNMINFGLKEIVNYPLSGEVFKEVNVAVSTFRLEKGYDGNTSYKEIKHEEIVENTKIKLIAGEPIITNGITSSIIRKIKEVKGFKSYDLAKNARMFSIASNGLFMLSDHTEDIIDYISKNTEEADVEVVFMDSSHSLYSKYTNKDKLPKGQEYVDMWKVICGSKAASNNSVLTNINLLKPGQIMTNSFGIIGIANSEEKAIAIMKYAKTQFHRFLVKVGISGDRVTYGIGCTAHVPLQDFTSNSDIDWSKSIEDIDKQLYKKYNLTDEEINYIEQTIKPMN